MIKKIVAIIIPTLNEAENINDLLSSIFKFVPDTEIIIVDDNSSDATRKRVMEWSEKDGRVSYIFRSGKKSFSRSCVEGIKKAIDGGAQYIIQMDADLSHNPQYLPLMLSALGESKLIIGSRYVLGGRIVNWDLRRRLISRVGNYAARLATGLPCKDLTSGFCGWRSDLLKKIPLDKIQTNGYAYLVEIKYLAWLMGGEIKEIPITFTERRNGRSKMSDKIIFESILFLLSVIIKRCLLKITKK